MYLVRVRLMLQELLPWPNMASQKYGLSEFCCQPSGSDHMQVLLKHSYLLTGTCMAFPWAF
jgi:hypothetical protein